MHRVSGFIPMVTANYDVYVNDESLMQQIAEHCNEHDLSESEFFREAARNQLQAHMGDGETNE